MHIGLTFKATQKLAHDVGVELKKSLHPSWHDKKEAGRLDTWFFVFNENRNYQFGKGYVI